MDRPPHPDTASLLRACGLRVTGQRLAILDYLRSTTAHPTAEQIGQAVNETHPTVSRASIYNVLHSLREKGLLREVVAGGAIVRYDANVERHDHFLCRICKRLEDVPVAPMPAALLPGDGRRAESCELLWRGVCRACASPGPAEERT